MPLIFPSNPTVNQTYQSGSTATYQYDGTKWTVVQPATTTVVTARSASFATSASFSTSSSLAESASIITSTSGSGLWVWSMGTPTSFGYTLGGNAFYSASAGVVLTPNTTNQAGTFYKAATTSYFTNNDFILSINARAGSGTGADGIAMYAGANNPAVSTYDGLTVFLDEFNDSKEDSITIHKNGVLFTRFSIATQYDGALDNNTTRKWDMIVTGPSSNRFLTIQANDVIVWRGSIGSWTPTGANYGTWGFTGGATNFHFVSMMNLYPAKMWQINNGLL